MSELTTGQLIKLILGVLVFVAVVGGLYLFFKDNVIEFFNGIFPDPVFWRGLL
ncbi:MAG: hypothetical protein NUV46_02105 [Nanoarchaeota archaeon]|nr:hypothetical protein [Nanoarchaeota archaeon]